MFRRPVIQYLVAAGLVLLAVPSGLAQEAAPPDPAAALNALQNSTDYMERLTAYRDLRQAGGLDAIPAIAAGLHNEKESHLARYALQGIPFPEAGAALRDALNGAPEAVLPGLLASLGARREASAVALIQPLINHANPDIAKAATGALGRIASPEAVAVLLEALTADPQRVDVGEGLLAAGQVLTDEKAHKEAATIFRVLRGKDNPDFVRVGAYYGLAKAAPGKTPARVLKSIQGKDPLYRNLAREVVAETKGKPATAEYVAALPALPDDAKVLLLEGLARRGDKSAREGVLAEVSSAHMPVRIAAVDALGALGNATDVPLLAGLLPESDDALVAAARNSLIRMRGHGVDGSIVKTLPEVTPPVRAQMLELLAVRISPASVPQAKKYLKDESPEVRLAALRVLQQQGSVSELQPVIALMESSPPADEGELAARTVGAIAAVAREEALPPLLASIAEAPDTVKPALVEALGKIGGAQALEPVLGLLDTSDATLKRSVLSVLESWPSQDAAPALLELAKSEDAARHDAGLRGYTRLAQSNPDHDTMNTMMATAMGLARAKEEKWVVLSAYGAVHTGPAMDMLESQLDDPEVQKEASMALLKVAEAVSKHGDGGKARVKQSMELLKEKAATDAIRAMAEKMLAQVQ